MAAFKFKPKNSILKLEDINTGIEYSLTINPNDKLQGFSPLLMREIKLHDILNKITNLIPLKYSVQLYPEISPKGRLHFHGRIMFSKQRHILQFYLSVIPDILNHATMEMDTIKEPEVWSKYCSKQSLFHNFLEKKYKYNIPYTSGLFKPVAASERQCDPDSGKVE